jgi:hypothetical protein
MRPRHGQSPRSLPASLIVAAAQLDFPKAVVRASLDRANPNRLFAARLIDVSHAGQTGPMQPRYGKSFRSMLGSHLVAAVQLDLPEAVVLGAPDESDRNRPFAACI